MSGQINIRFLLAHYAIARFNEFHVGTMHEFNCECSHFDCRERVMDAAKALKELSMPQTRDEKIPAIIARSAHLAGLTYSRCYEIWYGRARRIEPEEIARISEALKQKQALEARNELSELRLRLERLESILVLSDPEFHRENISAVRDCLRRSR